MKVFKKFHITKWTNTYLLLGSLLIKVHLFATFLIVFFPFPRKTLHWAILCKRLRSPRIDSASLFSQAGNRFLGSLKGLQISALSSESWRDFWKCCAHKTGSFPTPSMKQSKIGEISYRSQLTMKRFSSSGGSNEILKNFTLPREQTSFLLC